MILIKSPANMKNFCRWSREREREREKSQNELKWTRAIGYMVSPVSPDQIYDNRLEKGVQLLST